MHFNMNFDCVFTFIISYRIPTLVNTHGGGYAQGYAGNEVCGRVRSVELLSTQSCNCSLGLSVSRMCIMKDKDCKLVCGFLGLDN